MTTEAPKMVRPFWSSQRSIDGRIYCHEAPDGGWWWGSGVVIERKNKAPHNGTTSAAMLAELQRYASHPTIAVPDTYTLRPPKYEDEDPLRNYGVVGKDTLLVNDTYAAHFDGKGYRMMRVDREANGPVLYYKGDVLMGIVMPCVSPEYAEKHRRKGW